MLPHGLYDASLPEIRRVFGFSVRRESLIDGLEQYLRVWDRHRVLESAIIDGSFVTGKLDPGDIDILVVPKPEALGSMAFADLVRRLCYDRVGTKERYGCEAFPVEGTDSESYRERLGFFSRDRDGNIRGLLRVRLPL